MRTSTFSFCLLCSAIFCLAFNATARTYELCLNHLYSNEVYLVKYNSDSKYLKVTYDKEEINPKSEVIISLNNISAIIITEKRLKETDFLDSDEQSDGAIAFCDSKGKAYAVIMYTTSGRPDYIQTFLGYFYRTSDNEEFIVSDGFYEKISNLSDDEKKLYDTFMSLKGEITGAKYTPKPESKPAPKTESKPAPKTGPKSAPKQESKPAPKPAPKQETKSSYSATVTNPRFVVKEPGSDAHLPWMILYEVKAPKNENRKHYLFMQNVDTKEYYTDPSTRMNFFCPTDEMGLTSLYVEASQMPKATHGKPIRLTFYVKIQSPTNKGWVGQFQSPVYIWDGTYMRPAR